MILIEWIIMWPAVNDNVQSPEWYAANPCQSVWRYWMRRYYGAIRLISPPAPVSSRVRCLILQKDFGWVYFHGEPVSIHCRKLPRWGIYPRVKSVVSYDTDNYRQIMHIGTNLSLFDTKQICSYGLF